MNCTFPAVRSVRLQRRQGVALIITLIMLSVVTITAVAFLAISRRERLSISAYGEQIDARYLADTALNRARAQILGRMLSTTNPVSYRLAYGLAVSTNYQNPEFNLKVKTYPETHNLQHLTNVTYGKSTNSTQFDFAIGPNGKDIDLYAGVLGNLFYDPRPPVFFQVDANRATPWEFRYYLDLNRNGRFETNGLRRITDGSGLPNAAWGSEFMVGDPEWIGVLEHPDVPHSGTNRFIGRFAYIILPTGRSLDANFLGNNAKLPKLDPPALPTPTTNTVLTSGYLRNQGVGPWELNAAAFLRSLNTNVWLATQFAYQTNTTLNSGLAFSDAERILRYRRNGARPATAVQFFKYESGNDSSAIGVDLGSDRVDNFANGPLEVSLAQTLHPSLRDGDDDDPSAIGALEGWEGSDERRHFTDFNQLFDADLAMAKRLTGEELLAFGDTQRRRQHTNSTYNAYTFYRALGQLGTDSPDARFETGFHPAYGQQFGRQGADPIAPAYYRRAKLNLNYTNNPNGDRMTNASVGNLQRWTALNWFTNAADRLLLSELTNGLPIVRSPEIRSRINRSSDDARNYSPFGLPVHGQFRFLNGFETNYVYDSQVHRLLQFAANIYDFANASDGYNLPRGATNNFQLQAPHVYRPRFYVDERTPDVLRIADYELFENPNELIQQRWLTPEEALRIVKQGNQGIGGTVVPTTDLNVFGIPWVVGAKKGLPSFNEGFWQASARITRRLLIRKPLASTTLPNNQSVFSAAAASQGIMTLAQYRLTFTNTMGVEAWNSYSFDFPEAVTVKVRHTNRWALYSETAGQLKPLLPLTATAMNSDLPLAAGKWRAGEFIGTHTNLLADFLFDPTGSGRIYPVTASNLVWTSVGAPTPNLTLAITNQLVFTIESTGPTKKLLDVVSMQSVIYETNIFRLLGAAEVGGGIPIGGSVSQDSRPGGAMSQFWYTNRANLAGTLGISNQFLASLGRIDVGTLWRDAYGNGVRLTDREFAIDGLNYFLYRTNRSGLTAAQIEEIRRQFGGTNVQVGFNPSPMMVFTERRLANDPLVHYVKDDLLPGYSAVALAAPGYPGAYAAEVERNHTRLLQDGSVWGLAWKAVNINNPNTRWTNASFQQVAFRRESGWPAGITTNFWTDQIRPYRASDPVAMTKYQTARAPWGQTPRLGVTAVGKNDLSRQNYGLKDPQIYSSDDWRFLAQLTNSPGILNELASVEHFSYPNIGWLGRVHRGTPWQTAYLKSAVVPLSNQNGLDRAPWMSLFFGEINDWPAWAGNANTHPTYDWKLLDLFTTAINDNSAHGLLGVNQTNLAAWSAVLAGVPVLENTNAVNNPQPMILGPNSPEIAQIVGGYTNRNNVVVPGLMTMLSLGSSNTVGLGFPPVVLAPGGTFTNLGSVLSVPTLSDQAPFVVANAGAQNVTDEVLERLPQQILSLLRADEPLVTIYAYGQSLKPAPNSFYLSPGPFYGMVTNYVVTGEFATKSLVRFSGPIDALTNRVEDYRILYQTP